MTESTEKLKNAITELYHTFPQWEDKAIINQAYKDIGVSKDDFSEDFCPYPILSRIRFIRSLEKAIYTNDFSDIPTSTRISKAVNDNLPKLKEDFPNKEEIDILKMAYDMARGVLDNSDFEVVKEEPVYFEIFVENPAEFEAELKKQFAKQDDFDYNDWSDYTDDKAKFFAQDKPVSSSSNVAEIGYERGKLRIFFKNGGGYEYPVPSSWYTEMLNAPSKGSFVWETLRGKTPGRVIDNPNKTTPGGVGGSIVPYFKVKGAAMSPDAMRKSVTGFLRAARKGKAEAGGVPIRKIPKPEYKAFRKFMKKGAARFTPEKAPKTAKKPSSRKSTAPRQFKKIVKKILGKSSKKSKKKSTPKTPEGSPEAEDKSAVRERIKRIREAMKNARKVGLDDVVIKAMEKQIERLEKSISDFSRENKENKKNREIDYYNIVDDFSDDMRYFSGPITRAGNFEYNVGTKIKDYNNLTEVFSGVSHLPSFDSHNEDQIIGFAYNFTGNPDTEQIFSEGYTFNDVEDIADVSLDSDSKLPVSIRFLDANEGTKNPKQDITDLIHLAISVNRTDVDRCSSGGGKPCYVQFQDTKDFIENTLEQVGDFMPDKKEKKKEEKKPPKDKDEEDEEDEEDKDEGTSDKKKKKSDDSKDFKKDKNSKTEKTESNMIQIDKSVLEDFSKQLSDLKKENATRQKKTDNIERDKIIGDFSDKTQVYKIKSDFTKTASLETMRIIESALQPVNEEIDAQNQLFNSDFSTKTDNLQGQLEDYWKVKNKGDKK